jgi:peptidoglycan/LPS O-acetylase OafA/YrhL
MEPRMPSQQALELRTDRHTRRRLTAHDKVDICRGVFAFLVVMAHGLELTWSITPAVPGRLQPLLVRLLTYTAGHGIYWVMGFFVISGYCIYLSAQRLIDGESFPLRRYLLARATRIVPLYFIALLFTVFVEWWIAAARPAMWTHGLDPGTFLCQLLLIQNFTETYGSYAPSWSITNEVFYYVFYGLIVAGVVRFSKWPATIGMAVCLTIGVATQLVYRMGYRSNPMMQFGLLFGLGISWFFGALVAEHREWLVKNQPMRAAARCWPMLLALVIGLSCTQRMQLEFVLVGSGVAFTLMLAQFLIADERASDGTDGAPATHRSFIATLGLSSYPTYLFHGPILMLTSWVILRAKLNLDWRLTWAVATGVAIASGIALGHLAERPILAWRAALLRRQERAYRPRVYDSVDGPILGINR